MTKNKRTCNKCRYSNENCCEKTYCYVCENSTSSGGCRCFLVADGEQCNFYIPYDPANPVVRKAHVD